VVFHLMFLLPVNVECLLVRHCQTPRALRVLQVGMVVSYLVLVSLSPFLVVRRWAVSLRRNPILGPVGRSAGVPLAYFSLLLAALCAVPL